ncbi:MAG TPA: NAD-dependent epimerase/dehydratase family protein [Casimicrobiaceae bacterium]|jgi:nucleoside-diphosphate-sugar epimerase|nr:NAD-dependent epimerase/dehydratase family protein [Casimicrobiaceae bacterium]
MSGKILVTGADGFIGRALCARFQETGVPYVAAVRALPAGAAERAQYVALGDFAAADWHEVLGDVETVVHLAGLAHVTGRDAEAPTPFIVANVHVTRRLADTAARAGVRRIVLASTVKVYGETTAPGRPFRAGDPPSPHDAYAHSKAEAENVLREIATERGVEAIVLRLPLTYGPGVKGNFRALLESVAAGRRLPLGGIANRRSLLYVGNAVSAIEAAVSKPGLAGNALPIADAETVSTPELIEKLARALELEPRLFALPAPFLRGAAMIIGRSGYAMRLMDSLEVDALRFRGLTGWTPRYSLDQGLAATAAWWRAQRGL